MKDGLIFIILSFVLKLWNGVCSSTHVTRICIKLCIKLWFIQCMLLGHSYIQKACHWQGLSKFIHIKYTYTCIFTYMQIHCLFHNKERKWWKEGLDKDGGEGKKSSWTFLNRKDIKPFFRSLWYSLPPLFYLPLMSNENQMNGGDFWSEDSNKCEETVSTSFK